MTNARDTECECEIGPLMAWAGPAIALCHHSSVEEANQVREKLLDLIGSFTQSIDPNDMFKKTIIDLASDYRQEVAGKRRSFWTRTNTPSSTSTSCATSAWPPRCSCAP